MSNFSHELRTVTRLFLPIIAAFAASSQVEAQQYVYYPTAPAPAAAPTYTYPTYAAPLMQAVGAIQYYQTAPQVQYAQPAAPTQYYQSAYDGMAAAQPTQATQAPAAAPAAASSGDSYGFTAWLNGVRASYGLGAVGYDPNLEGWAAQNNNQQAARGLGHYVMGPARRQNSAMGGFPGVEAMWLASPAHRAALLDPTISFIGIAGAGAWWTFNAY